MTIADKIADSADKAAQTIAETTGKVTEKIADKVGHKDAADTPTGQHRGPAAAEDDKPGLIDKLTDASERLGTKIEEVTARHDHTGERV